MSSEKENFIDQLQRIHHGDAWHGPALTNILSDVNDESALATPLPEIRSIWELVLHIAAWEEVFARRLEGELVDQPEEGDFPPISATGQVAWEQTRRRLDQANRRLIEIVSKLREEDLNKTIPGKDFDVRFMIAGLVRHNVYHAGQISLLKKALTYSTADES